MEEVELVIRQMVDQGVPNLCAESQAVGFGLTEAEEAQVLLILDQSASLSAALRSVFQIPRKALYFVCFCPE